ncbi:MAG: SDR family oxidoreductase [Frankiaceae bacterium]
MGVRARLAGRRVLLTGVTGFVGEALLERLLSDVPEAEILVLVRALGGLSARDRIVRLVDKPAFAALRERLGPDLPRFVDEHVGVIEGDLARMPDLPPDLDIVIHCAGEVSFDPPIDAGFATNLGGVQELVRAIRAGGSHPHIVHISTAYVAGLRSGWIREGRVEHSVDWRAEQAAAVRAREQAEDASRAPDVLRKFRAEADAEHVRAGAETVARDAERRRRHWVDARLVDAGRERARVLGWTDCYTFTKALGERYLEQEAAGLARSIVRPSIIESALARPHPGWITGFKMAEPIILAYGRGELPDFPGSPDGVIDIIHVDLVVNAILVAAAHPPAPEADPAYYHVCSGNRNPLLFHELYEHVRGYFRSHPLTKRDRGPIAVPVWHFPGGRAIDARLRRGERAVDLAGRALAHLPPSERVRQRARDLDRTAGKLAFLRRFQELYSAYAQAELIYADDATRALHESLTPEDQALFGVDPTCFGWRYYLQDVHCPAVTAGLRALSALPRRPQRHAGHDLTPGDGILAVFDMDGTLVSSTVVESYLWLRLAELSAPGRLRELAAAARALPGWLRTERRDRGWLIRSVYTRYAGADPEELERIVADGVGDAVLARASAPALRRVREHCRAGHRTVLLTGAIEALNRPLAPLFDEVVAARLAVGPDGRCTGGLAAAPLVGDARAAWLRRHAGQTGAGLHGSWAYADSHSDLPLLRAVGHPVAVNPDLGLATVARKEGWPVEEWPATRGPGRLTHSGITDFAYSGSTAPAR